MRINPEWIRTGAGPIRLTTGEANESLPHVVKVTEVRPPAERSSQELFTELVRRAMVPFDFEEIQKQAMATWMPNRQGATNGNTSESAVTKYQKLQLVAGASRS